jgi:epoxyqueuosine reductase QueG
LFGDESVVFGENGISFFSVEESRMESKHNFLKVQRYIGRELGNIGYDGVVGVTEFEKVHNCLMPSQRNRLKSICGSQFQTLRSNGSIICIAIAYPERAIDCIDVKLSDGTVDKEAWNIYALEYHKLNRLLKVVSESVSDQFGGIPIPPTVEGIAVKNVEGYYGMTVSHRVIAENAGLGWRGKNELIVHRKFSCALRFASVITDLPLSYGRNVRASCGECKACLEACPFLKSKEKLENYRENCRRYIIQLGLVGEVCGKCIKACYRHSIFRDSFRLRQAANPELQKSG